MNASLLRPLHGEILSSWIIRNALKAGTDPLGWVGGIWPHWRAWTRDIDRHIPHDRLAELASMCETDTESLHRLTLEPFITYLSGDGELSPRKAWPWVIPTGRRNLVQTNGLHFCPQCLKEEAPYLKRAWRLSWNTACETHGTLLALHCPTCNTVFSPHRIEYTSPGIGRCISCGFDLGGIETDVADSGALLLQRELNLVLEGNILGKRWGVFDHVDDPAIEAFAFVRSMAVFLRRFSRQEARFANFISEFDNLPAGDEDTRVAGTSIDAVSAKMRHFYFAIVQRLFDLGESGIVELLQRHGVMANLLEPSKSGSSAYRRIADRMPRVERSKRAPSVRKQEIRPRSREEVEALFDKEIRPFI